MKYKRFKFVTISALLLLFTLGALYGIYHLKPELYQSYSRKIPYNLRVPTNHIKDEADLLSYSYEFRLNQFLDHLEERYATAFRVNLLTSSQGFSLSEKIRPIINELDGNERFGIFFLSLSDRQFKIYLSPMLEQEIGSEELDFLVELVRPGLTRMKYEEGISQFFSTFAFKLDPNSSVVAPHPSIKENQNSKTLFTFFIVIFIFFLMGRKILTRPRSILKNIHKQNADTSTRYQSFY